jgi:hypothetical protein
MKHAPVNPVTAEELDAALPSVLAAPRDAGIVRMLCTRPKPNTRSFPEVLTLTRSKGVSDDYHQWQPWLELPDGSPDPRIEVSLADTDLPVGTRLSVGTAILRVSDVPNDGCAKWRVRCGRPAYNWIIKPDHLKLRLRGLYALIEQDGEVRLGDTLRRL